MALVDYIPLEECEDGAFYSLTSRHLTEGVFCEKTKRFIGIREKRDLRWLDAEFHGGTGHGTAWPLKFLGHTPGSVPLAVRNNSALYGWLAMWKP